MSRSSNPGSFGSLTACTLLALLSGCAVGPAYHRPDAPLSHAFKEAGLEQTTDNKAWKMAQPNDNSHRGQWWRVFNDPVLDGYERQAAQANQNLQAAVARVQQSRALTRSVEAQRFATLDAGVGPTRQRLSPASQFYSDDGPAQSQTLWRAQATVSYEADLFGRISSQVDAATAQQAQSEAMFRSVQLALQADVAKRYFQLRQYDRQRELYRRAVTLRESTRNLIQRRFEEGEVSEMDLSRANSELSHARADAIGVARLRAIAEHSLAILLGKSPAHFSIADAPLDPVTVSIPPGLPSALLERRPDIASAERAMAVANAQIGLAKSAFFPQLNISAAAGFESGSLANLFDWSTRAFLLGPLTGTALTLPVLDGGRRNANLASAVARYDEQVAKYRETILTAFVEVEDQLSELRLLDEQMGNQGRTLMASQRTEQLAKTQYNDGQVDYLDVIDAQRQVLQAELQMSRLIGDHAGATVSLIRALGGQWGELAGNYVAPSKKPDVAQAP